MRPQSIIMFERLFLGSLLLSVLSFAIGYEEMMALLTSDPALAQIGIGTGFMIGVVAGSYAIYLLLWYLIAHKASNAAKWVLIVFLVLGLLSLPTALAGPWTLTVLLGLAVYALEIAAVVFLFKPDAKAWFAGSGAADPSTFD